nr:integrase, catalytic region, zinc finger, CCHC-type, peptidase aspartic, catalytic [Tanacetum cinerariifolium]
RVSSTNASGSKPKSNTKNGRVSSTNASGSKPKSNTKNGRIPQPLSISMKNKVEAHHRKFKSSANKNNHVSDCNANVKDAALSKSFDTIRLSLPSGNRLHTIRIPAIAPNAKARMRYSISKNSLIRAHINSYGDSFNPSNFAFNLEGVDLLSGSRASNLYTILMADMMKSSPICLLSKALEIKSWLWHRRLSHLKFDTIN